VPGLKKVTSVTSRGSAEVDLFFDWNSDMILTLQRVDAVVARLQADLPPTAKVETHRMTFAIFPIIGYSLTSDIVPPNKLWEIATYDLKPRLNRLDGRRDRHHTGRPRSRISSDTGSRAAPCCGDHRPGHFGSH